MTMGLTLEEQFQDGYISEDEYNGIMSDINVTNELLGQLKMYDTDYKTCVFHQKEIN